MYNSVVVLEPERKIRHYWADLWRFRELFLILAWRDISVRYKQTVIGLAWAVLRPLLTMAVFTLVFSRIAKLPSDGATPYALLVFAALLPWQFFSSSLSEAANSLLENAKLITKVYFPRLIIPVAAIVAAFAEILVSLFILIVLMAFYRVSPSLNLLFLPVFILLAFLAALGPGLYFAALNVKYRDFRYAIPFFIQVGLYVSPVGFSSRLIDDEWRLIFSLNPMAGVIDGFRWCILGEAASPLFWPGLLLGTLVALLMLFLGLRRFRAMERAFADVI